MAERRSIAAGRLLAEAARYLEGASGQATDDAAAVAAARQADGSLETKIITRATALPAHGQLAAEISHLWTMLRGLVTLLFIVAAGAGAATARTAFATVDGTTVNFFWALASLLGLHLLSFVLWIILLSAPRLSQGGALGRGALWLWRQAAERLGANRHRAAALQAFGTRYLGGKPGRWLASSLSHTVWFGYLGGATVMVVALLSAQRYTFVWETTILDAGAYTSLTAVLAALPAALGITVPDMAAAIAAEWPGSPDLAHQGLWSSLLVSALLLYGLAPRGVALLVTAVMCRRAVSHTVLDMTIPYYAELAARLTPTVTATRIVDGDTDRPTVYATPPALRDLPPPPPAGPVFLIGWEVDTPHTGWPPPGAGTGAHDLGRRDGASELDAAINAIDSGGQQPGRLIIVVDMRQPPDRGVTTVLKRLRTAARGRAVVVLSGAAAMRQRMQTEDAAGDRLSDWVAAALAAGVEADHMIALDLDGDATEIQSRLTKLVGVPA